MGYSLRSEFIVIIGIPIYLVVFAIHIFKRYKKNIKIKWFRELVKFVFVIYVLMLMSVTLFPIYIGIDHDPNYYRLPINLIPFKNVIKEIGMIGTSYGGDIVFHIKLILRNVVGNTILLLPLGVMSPIIWGKFTRVKMIILEGLIVSIFIELLQLIEILSGIAFMRAVDIDDLILNVLGVIIGYLIYKLTFYISNKYHIKSIMNLFAESTKEHPSDGTD
ncbi:VanZ family protein [Clostridium sp. D2Q-11]|uniref:VanZ family protein n=1 Tax=Anaeromonas frigoriresistens TaxID=2683708 RepID=A0A942UZY3_9FIRM|nr:VanZ family protein [Anaeromonas frigoriresistens]MBS4537542.1 VanZ family protein [Anaeromonas frigoriresistens]